MPRIKNAVIVQNVVLISGYMGICNISCVPCVAKDSKLKGLTNIIGKCTKIRYVGIKWATDNDCISCKETSQEVKS